MNTVNDMYKEAIGRIDKSDAYALLCDMLCCDRSALLLKKDYVLSESECNILMQRFALAESGMPIAYITGKKEFYSLTFEVTPDVLIPRPDTEILVEFAIQNAKGKHILDICTGSGCIGLSTAYYAPCKITLLDISEKALKIARRNAKRLNINAEFILSDILQDEIDGNYDMILANPPYIETDVIPTLEKNVCEFEPLLALDGGNDGLIFYPIIAKKANNSLKKDGILAVEVGFNQAKSVENIFSSYFENTTTLNDLSGIPRVVIGKRPISYI